MSTTIKPNYIEVKKEYGERLGHLMHECGIFWAFSDKQFEENKTPLEPGEKYVSIGAGGYMPKQYTDRYINGMKALAAWDKQARKDLKAEQVILYELNNFEAFYSGDITDSMEVLAPMGYTAEQVRKVYADNRHELEERYN